MLCVDRVQTEISHSGRRFCRPTPQNFGGEQKRNPAIQKLSLQHLHAFSFIQRVQFVGSGQHSLHILFLNFVHLPPPSPQRHKVDTGAGSEDIVVAATRASSTTTKNCCGQGRRDNKNNIMTAIYSAAAAAAVEESSTIEPSTTDHESSSSQTTIAPPPPSDFIVMTASSVVSPRPRTPPSFRRESIAVSDTGTEVTLTHAEEEDDDEGFFTSEQPNTAVLVQRSPSSNSDKKDDDPRSRSFSLLDNDLASVVTTTTPLSPETPISSTLPLCGVVGCWSVPEETGGAAPGNSSIRSAACMEDGLQDYLYEFLSDPSSGGGGGQKAFPWQAMLTSMADDSDEDYDEDDDDDEEREIKKHRMKILRNRAIHLQARKERLDTLRRDLHPFSYYSGPATPPLPGVGATGSSLAIIGN
jgi:hypothetical protein